MNLLAEWERRQSRKARRRWLTSSATVLLICSAWLAFQHWHPASAAPFSPPMAAMVIELKPLQAPSQPSQQPVGETQVEAPRPQPTQPPLLPKIESTAKSDIALPQAEPKQEPMNSDQAPAAETRAPSHYEAASADTAAAPQQSAAAASSSTERASFEQLLLGHLQSHKRYPRAAQMRRQQGVPYLRFTMRRDGSVLNASLERATAFAALNDEALALLYRAQPLPHMPDTLAGDTLEVVVPVEFFMPPA